MILLSWVWDDQSRTSWTNWYSLDYSSPYNKDCVIVGNNFTQMGHWILVNCAEKHPAICQKVKGILYTLYTIQYIVKGIAFHLLQ